MEPEENVVLGDLLDDVPEDDSEKAFPFAETGVVGWWELEVIAAAFDLAGSRAEAEAPAGGPEIWHSGPHRVTLRSAELGEALLRMGHGWRGDGPSRKVYFRRKTVDAAALMVRTAQQHPDPFGEADALDYPYAWLKVED